MQVRAAAMLISAALVSGGCLQNPGQVQDVQLDVLLDGTAVALCWSDDEIYEKASDTGALFTPADVLYRAYRRPTGENFTFDLDDFVVETTGADAQTSRPMVCDALLEFGVIDTSVPPGMFRYSVCRVISGERSGCSAPQSITVSGSSADSGAIDAGTPDSGPVDGGPGTDAGDAAPGTDAVVGTDSTPGVDSGP